MNVLYYTDDLLRANVDVIAHQCNCMSKGAAGLAAAIFKRHPEANTYNQNPRRDLYGSWEKIEVQGAPYRAVLNLFTQLYPGGPSDVGVDSASARIGAFAMALIDFLSHEPGISIALPHGIGCGLAGGQWTAYETTIHQIASEFADVEFHIISLST